MGIEEKKRKQFFLNHKKSSALVVSIAIHSFFLIVALSFVAVKIIVKPEQIFEVKEVKRPTIKLRKLQVPVKNMKKTQAPKLRKTIVARPKNIAVDIKMPEIVGVKGGTGYGRSGGLGGLGFSFNMNFFGLSSKAMSHIVFIIDYSGSMKGEKEAIMRRELARVLSDLPEDTDFGMIFFAGPAWPAGKGGSVVSSDWVKTDGEDHSNTYRPKDWDRLQSVDYERATSARISRMIRVVESTPLSGGTVYDCPIYMALKMKPLPDKIFFITDGACSTERGIVSLRKMVDQLKAAGEKIPVMHTIGFGISRNAQLEQMAALMGGESKFLTTEEYIRKYGPNEDKPSQVNENEVKVGKIEAVPADRYSVKFELR
jgi:hypothetical protein